MAWFFKFRWLFVLPIAGVMFTLSFAPFSYAVLAPCSLFLVFLSWLNCSAIRAAGRGYLFGLGVFGSGIAWVFISVHYYGKASVVASLSLTLFSICFWALFPALTGYFSVKLLNKFNKFQCLWIFPLSWILVEYFRGFWFLNGFPWLLVGYSQLNSPLAGFIPLVGSYGVGLLIAFTAIMFVVMYKRLLKYQWALGFIGLIWGGGVLLQSIQWTYPVGESIKVALIQGNVEQDKKWLPQYRVKTLLDYKKLTELNWDADVIVWPETAVPAFYYQVKKSLLDPLADQALSHNSDVIIGLPVRGENKAYYNSVISLGGHEGRYNKSHLLPFGEYLPLQPLSGLILEFLDIPLGNFSSGNGDQNLLIAAGYPMATTICYEDAFSDSVIHSLPGAAFLLNVTNDAWFGDSIQPFQHMQIAQMRAVESGRYLLRATNTGVTGVVSPQGEIIDQAPLFKQHVLRSEILPMGGLTPYSRVGDHPLMIALGVFFVFMCFFLGMKENADASLQTSKKSS